MKTKNKIMSIFLLPLSFTLFLPTNSISANLSEEQEKLISDFEIISAQFDSSVVYYDEQEDDLVIDIEGSFAGDISNIKSATLVYDIKENTETEFNTVTVGLTIDMFTFYEYGSKTYFLVEIPIYYDIIDGNLISLEMGIDYQVNNPTMNVFDVNNQVISSTYPQDFEFITRSTIIDNGDPSYPKPADASFWGTQSDYINVVYTDAAGYDFTNTSNYSLYLHYDLYDMYDYSGIPIENHIEKLNPIGETGYLTSESLLEGNYYQSYEYNILPTGSYQGYKMLNTSIIFVPNQAKTTQSSILMASDEVYTPDITSNIIETNVNGTNDPSGEYYINDTYVTLDFYYDQFENINSYAKYMEHIEISYDLTYNSSSHSNTSNHVVEAKEVDGMTTLLFNTPGLYYEEVNMDEANLHYQYTLVFPNNASWDTVEVSNVHVLFPMGASEFDGETLTSTTIDYDYSYSSLVYQDLGIIIHWSNFTKDENFIW